MDAWPATMSTFCAGCGAALVAGQRFCTGCGQSIDDPAATNIRQSDPLATTARTFDPVATTTRSMVAPREGPAPEQVIGGIGLLVVTAAVLASDIRLVYLLRKVLFTDYGEQVKTAHSLGYLAALLADVGFFAGLVVIAVALFRGSRGAGIAGSVLAFGLGIGLVVDRDALFVGWSHALAVVIALVAFATALTLGVGALARLSEPRPEDGEDGPAAARLLMLPLALAFVFSISPLLSDSTVPGIGGTLTARDAAANLLFVAGALIALVSVTTMRRGMGSTSITLTVAAVLFVAGLLVSPMHLWTAPHSFSFDAAPAGWWAALFASVAAVIVIWSAPSARTVLWTSSYGTSQAVPVALSSLIALAAVLTGVPAVIHAKTSSGGNEALAAYGFAPYAGQGDSNYGYDSGSSGDTYSAGADGSTLPGNSNGSLPGGTDGTLATVLADDTGESSVTAYAGPGGDIFAAAGLVGVGTRVWVRCTVYGQPVTGNGGSGRLWDYTNVGWLSDQLVDTGSPNPVEGACWGNVAHPQAGSELPSKQTGPFVIAGEITTRSDPATHGAALVQLQFGDLVRFLCATRTRHQIAPPVALTAQGANDAWDETTGDNPGWVPDSYVASYTHGPAEPPCG